MARARRGLRVLLSRRAERDVVEDVDPARSHLRLEQRERVVLRLLEERGVAHVLLQLAVGAGVRVRGEPEARLTHRLAGVAHARVRALEELMHVRAVGRRLLDAP